MNFLFRVTIFKSLQLHNGPLLVFWKVYLNLKVNWEAYQRKLFNRISVILNGVA